MKFPIIIQNSKKVLRRIIYYFKIWLLMSKNSFIAVMSQKKLLFIFLLAKILRFTFFIAFLYFLVMGAESKAGYTVTQIIFFFLTFNLVDVTSQFLFREVYRFRPLVVTGDFDLILVKPFSALFRVLLGGADIIDLITIPPLLITIYLVGVQLEPTTLEVIIYTLLIVNSLMIATAFHIAVVSMGMITLEIDHTIMIYRDLTNLGRLPVDIYKEPLRGVLTYLIPVGIMITQPAKVFMGFFSLWGVIVSLSFGVLSIFTALRFWNFALKKYTSASS
mgnify:CR=1 FL=1